MCIKESHQNLTQPEHFVRHTMEVEQACSMVRRGLGNVSIEHAMEEANYALILADSGVSTECTRMLRLVIEGNLQAASRSAT